MIDDTGARLLWALVFGVVGLAVGSFLNVVIHRVPRKESVVRPRSRCPECETPIAPRDNVPVMSWLVLRGRCRHCDVAISPRYMLVELACGVLFGAMAWHFQVSWALPGYLLLTATLLAVSAIDLEHYIIPNRILLPVVLASVPLLALASAAEADWATFGRSLGAAVVAFGALLLMNIISPRGMGMGDVKLAFLLGLYLGWLSWGRVALGLFLGFLLGAVVGVALIAAKVRGRKDHVPFGPFLAVGTLVAVLWGGTLLDWYTGL